MCMSVTRGESGWQFNRTVLECNRYMLDNEVATDVCFEVGPSDGATVMIRAHRYMLMSRSEVFEAMLCSEMSETQQGPEAKVRIEDIDPDVFREVLSYVYCDDSKVTSATALPLMYAAKKYMLPKLIHQCSRCLQRDLSIHNVGDVLNLSLVFDEEELKTVCLDFIARNPSEVLKPENLKRTSRDVMEVIVQLDSLAEDETFLYDTCISWAKIQLRRQGTENPTDEQIRETLGSILYGIRFPAMNLKEFAEVVEDSNVLTYEEQSSVFCYIANTRRREGFRFCCREKRSKKYGEEEFVDRSGRHSTSWVSGPDAIDVRTTGQALLTGIGLFTESRSNGSGYLVNLEVLRLNESLCRMSATVPYTGSPTPYKVSLESPVNLEPNVIYTLVASSSAGKHLYFGGSCKETCTKGNVAFLFSTSERENNGTESTQGQIPRIYFRAMLR